MSIIIENRQIGPGHPVFIIAEMSANHLQDYDRAVEIIRSAKRAGADAIKLQTYTGDTITLNCDSEIFRINRGTKYDGKTFYELYQQAYTPWDWHKPLQEIAKAEKIIFFSTPFDPSAVDLLEALNVKAYKIASFEIFDIPLIEYVASKGKPVILSTGIASLGDIEAAVSACRRRGNNDIVLLKCCSSYPAPYSEMNLATIPNMSATFGVPCGLSDHTPGIAVPVCSVGLGACVVEKHFTLSRDDGGPDAPFSLEPHEFKEMVDSVRIAEAAIGKISYDLDERVLKNRKVGRSLFIVKDIKAGEIFTHDNLRSIRPGNGMSPRYLPDIIGKCANKDISRGTPLKWDLIRQI